jgi:hypothetical protein
VLDVLEERPGSLVAPPVHAAGGRAIAAARRRISARAASASRKGREASTGMPYNTPRARRL